MCSTRTHMCLTLCVWATQLERSQARDRKQQEETSLGGGASAGPPGRYGDLNDHAQSAGETRARHSQPEGAELIAALEEALLGAGIRGSLREQARALERAAPPPRHRRLPSDPNAPDFAVVAAATLSPHDGAPHGASGAGGAAFGYTPSPVSANATAALVASLGSRGRSISMAQLLPTAEEEEPVASSEAPRRRRFSVEVSASGAARASRPGLSRGVRSQGAAPPAAAREMTYADWETAHQSLPLDFTSMVEDGAALFHRDGDGASDSVDHSDEDLEESDSDPERMVVLRAFARVVHGTEAEGSYASDDECSDGDDELDDGEEVMQSTRHRVSSRHAAAPDEASAIYAVGSSRNSSTGSGPVVAWINTGDGVAPAGRCDTCPPSPVRDSTSYGPGRDPPPSPAGAASPLVPRERSGRLRTSVSLDAQTAALAESMALEALGGADSSASSSNSAVMGNGEGSADRVVDATATHAAQSAGEEHQAPETPPRSGAISSSSAVPAPAVAAVNGAANGGGTPVLRVSMSSVGVADRQRLQWERTVSSLDSLLNAAGGDGADDGNDLIGDGVRKRGSDPLTEACIRANQRVTAAVTAARHLFSLHGMLTSPDAAPLRVAFKEAREFADALASVQPAARRLLMADLTTSVTDASNAAGAGMEELSKYLQSQKRACPCANDEGQPPPAACSDISGVVAGAKPLGEALHALMRWAKNVSEFAQPQCDATQLEAMSVTFTTNFMRLALLWGALVADAHAARRPGVDDWNWAHALEDLGKDQLLFVRSLSLQAFAQGVLLGQDLSALKDTVDSTVVIVKALDAELSTATPAPMTVVGAPPLIVAAGSGDGSLAGMASATGAGGAAVGGDDDASSGAQIPTPPTVVAQRDGWEVDMTDVRLGHKVGSGSYGQVFRATWRSAPVAVKLFDKQYADSEELLANVRREAALMARHRHPHVVLFMGVCTRPPNLAIVTEFCDNGSLLDVLKAKRDDPASLPWVRRLAFGADAARGLNYLHTSRPATIHADLNTSNLLVDRGWRVKVGDFGLSRLLQNSQSGVLQGTNVANKNASHLAPEVLRTEPYGTPSDVFSFGCVLWTLATLAVPWERLQAQGNNLAIAHAIAYERQRLDLPPATVPPFPDLGEYNTLIAECFQEDPAARPRMDVVLERLVHMQQRCARRTREEEQMAAIAAGTAPPTPTHGKALTVSTKGSAGRSGQHVRNGSLDGGADTGRAIFSLHRRASDGLAAVAAAAAHWGQPSSWGPGTTLLALGGLPLCTAALAWCAARYVYAQQQTHG